MLKLRLRLHRCLRCWRRGYHELRADQILVARLCDKHGAKMMEAMAPVADEIVIELEDGTTITAERASDGPVA